jgi:hypothetical protein
MGNKETSLAESIDNFEPFIFPEAVEEAEKLRKKLNIGKGKGVLAFTSFFKTSRNYQTLQTSPKQHRHC